MCTKHLLVLGMHAFLMYFDCISIFSHLKKCFRICWMCVYYYDYLYVFYMLDVGERAIELMFSLYCHTDENKDYLYIASMSKKYTYNIVISVIYTTLPLPLAITVKR